MKPDESPRLSRSREAPALPADFARHVIEEVQRVRQRRLARRRAFILGAVAGALVLGALLLPASPARFGVASFSSTPRASGSGPVAGATGELSRSGNQGDAATDDALALFFPDAQSVADFALSYANSWSNETSSSSDPNNSWSVYDTSWDSDS